MVPAAVATANIYTISLSLPNTQWINWLCSILATGGLVLAAVAGITFLAPPFFVASLRTAPIVAPVGKCLLHLVCHDEFSICQYICALLHIINSKISII